jgi:hypothetical protein
VTPAALAVALLVSGGCLSSAATAAKPTVIEIRHTTAAWVPGHHTTREGPRHSDVYFLSCSQVEGYPKAVAAMCGQLVRHPERYFRRVSVDLAATMRYTDFVTVRGVVNGSPVTLTYDAGAKPQFPWWMRLLAVLRQA